MTTQPDTLRHTTLRSSLTNEATAALEFIASGGVGGRAADIAGEGVQLGEVAD